MILNPIGCALAECLHGFHNARHLLCTGISQSQKRIACGDLFFPVGYHVFPVQGQINILRGHKQRIEQMSHTSSSIAPRR